MTLDGRPYTAADLNFWGVTFAPRRQPLLRHDVHRRPPLPGRRATSPPRPSAPSPRTSNARPCPPTAAASPSKQPINGDPAKGWRLSVLDLASGARTPLAETRSVDDQAAWLDPDTIAYAIPTSPADADIWTVPADGTGTPHLLIPHAESPAALG